MSLKKIAELTGYSVSTVSKAFAGKADVSEGCRQKIFTAAKKLGLYDKYIKIKPDKKIIALIVPEFASEYYSRVVARFSECITGHGALLTVAESGFVPDNAEELFNYFAYTAGCDGVIIFDTGKPIKNPDKFPVVIVGAINHEAPFDFVDINITDTIKALVRLLAENGHRRIAFIGETHTSSKYVAFKEAMEAFHLAIDPSLVKIAENSRFEQAGYDAMNELLKSKTFPTAVLAAYDYMAIGAIKCIEDHGLSVPEDISLVGMDNIYACENLKTPLTSASVFSDSMFDIIYEMLMRKINNKNLSLKSQKIQTPSIVKRQSIKNISAE